MNNEHQELIDWQRRKYFHVYEVVARCCIPNFIKLYTAFINYNFFLEFLYKDYGCMTMEEKIKFYNQAKKELDKELLNSDNLHVLISDFMAGTQKTLNTIYPNEQLFFK